MKVQEIKLIEKYKNFKSLNPNNLEFHDNLNLFFGENGNGKSSIVDIFKNISKNKDFETSPEKVKLKIDENEYGFVNNYWNQCIDTSQFIFFDDNFISKNIHTNKERNNNIDGPAQNSSHFLISIDEEAIRLRELEVLKKREKKRFSDEIKEFEKTNKHLLSNDYDKFEKIFSDFNSEGDIGNLKCSNQANIVEIKSEISELEMNKKNSEEIQNLQLDSDKFKFEIINLEEFNKNLNQILRFDIKENTIESSKEELINYIKNNKEFFEKGFDIREKQENKYCPFCLNQHVEDSIKSLFDLKNKIFDESYKSQINLFDQLNKDVLNFLEIFSNRIFSFYDFFLEIEEINTKFKIEGFYNLKEKEEFKEFRFEFLKKIKEEVLKINSKNNKEFVFENLDDFNREVDKINAIIIRFNTLVEKKKEILNIFKSNNSTQKLEHRLIEKNQILEKLEFERDFLTNFNFIKDYFNVKSDLKERNRHLELLKEDLKKLTSDYKSYCRENIFQEKADLMTEYLNKFNLNFEIRFHRTDGGHNIVPFTFKIVDKETGDERSLNEGLSNGELQILGISFFLTCLDSYGDDLKSKVIFFDDPVSSLDNSNLNILIDILKNKIDDLNQVFIFTHHLTFFKFLSKKFRDIEPKEFILLKNKYDLGGSFYCQFGKNNFFNSLKKFNEIVFEQTKIHNIYSYEKNVLKYGQYLRYEVEKFIKNDLLAWNKSDNFSNIVETLKIRNLSQEDVEEIKKIYQFCNWTTSHVDIHENCFLNRLKENIDKFIEIKERNS